MFGGLFLFGQKYLRSGVLSMTWGVHGPIFLQKEPKEFSPNSAVCLSFTKSISFMERVPRSCDSESIVTGKDPGSKVLAYSHRCHQNSKRWSQFSWYKTWAGTKGVCLGQYISDELNWCLGFRIVDGWWC